MGSYTHMGITRLNPSIPKNLFLPPPHPSLPDPDSSSPPSTLSCLPNYCFCHSLAAAKIYFNVEPRCFLMQYIIFQNYLNVGNKMLHIYPIKKSWIRRKNGPNMKKIDIEQFDRPLATGIYLTQ